MVQYDYCVILFVATGVSADPCAQTFPGSGPFSEKCTQNMRDRISELSGNIKLYMAVHSYSQMWLTPWGFGSPKPADYSELVSVADWLALNFALGVERSSYYTCRNSGTKL